MNGSPGFALSRAGGSEQIIAITGTLATHENSQCVGETAIKNIMKIIIKMLILIQTIY